MTPTAERKHILGRIWDKLQEPESGLVVCWFDIVKTLVFLGFIFVCLSPVLDAFYGYIGSNSTGFYTEKDIGFAEDIYNLWKFIPLVGFGLVIFYAINYANWKRDN